MSNKKKSNIEQKTEVLKTVTLGKTKETTIRYTRQNANGDYYKMQISDILKILENVNKDAQKNKKDVQTVVRVVSDFGKTTLKGYSDTVDRIEDYDEYFRNKVKDTDQFDDFYQVYITYKVK